MSLSTLKWLIPVLFAQFIFAQPRTDKRNLYERVYAVVPLIGKGTPADPIRPMYAPTEEELKKGSRSGIIAFHYELSDNGKFALVEFVLGDRAALDGLKGKLANVKSAGGDLVDRDTGGRVEVERAFKGFKKGFDFANFQVVVP